MKCESHLFECVHSGACGYLADIAGALSEDPSFSVDAVKLIFLVVNLVSMRWVRGYQDLHLLYYRLGDVVFFFF